MRKDASYSTTCSMMLSANLPTLVPPNFCTTQLLRASEATGRSELRRVVAMMLPSKCIMRSGRKSHPAVNLEGETGESGALGATSGCIVYIFFLRPTSASRFVQEPHDIGPNHAICLRSLSNTTNTRVPPFRVPKYTIFKKQCTRV